MENKPFLSFLPFLSLVTNEKKLSFLPFISLGALLYSRSFNLICVRASNGCGWLNFNLTDFQGADPYTGSGSPTVLFDGVSCENGVGSIYLVVCKIIL